VYVVRVDTKETGIVVDGQNIVVENMGMPIAGSLCFGRLVFRITVQMPDLRSVNAELLKHSLPHSPAVSEESSGDKKTIIKPQAAHL
jgi:DnaJ-class molecular chaperone